ncbi:response regulator transcription factor [Bacillus cereus]|nr:response regulator transcription factor [Bacillus cereus]
MYKILIVENDVNVSSILKLHLEQYAYNVVIIDEFKKVMEYFNAFHPHLVLLGRELPVFDGFYWLQKIRSISICPIIFISNVVNKKDQIRAFTEGADDYISKPLFYKVIVAKIKGYLRRSYGDYTINPSERFMEVKGLKLYPERLEIHFKTNQIVLTKNEGIIAEILFLQFPRTVTHKELLCAIGKDKNFVSESILYVNILRIRKKLDGIGVKKVIKTVNGIGYRLNIMQNN